MLSSAHCSGLEAPRCGYKLAMCLLGRSSGAESRNSDYASIQHKGFKHKSLNIDQKDLD